MDITAIAGVAAQQGMPGDVGRTREALGQEFGRMLFQTLMQGATAHGGHGKGRKSMQALPLDFYSSELARQLAVQHGETFGALLFSDVMGGKQR